jgi:predicted GNAT family acetyltransferase
MQSAGIKTRKRIQETMGRIYADTRKNIVKLLDKVAPANLPEMTRKQAEILLYRSGKAGAFSKIAFENMGSDVRAVKRLRNEMAQAIMRGEDDAKIIKRIQNVTGMEKNDAMRVLRTERTHIESLAMQDTAMEHYKATGTRPRKRWICMFRNSRDSHMAMHGQTVFIDEDFTLPSGGAISYPGDSSAGASEVCNCQCTMEVLEG